MYVPFCFLQYALCPALPPTFAFLPRRKADRILSKDVLSDPRKRARVIRAVFAFPLGHTYAWADDDLKIDPQDRMLVEWGLFQNLTLGSRQTYASTVTAYLRWADAVGLRDPWPLNEYRASLFAAYRLRHDK